MVRKDQIKQSNLILLISIIVLSNIMVFNFSSENQSFAEKSEVLVPKPNSIVSEYQNNVTFSLNQEELGYYETYDIKVTPGILYNYTLNNIGNATFDLGLVKNAAILDYINQDTTYSYSDEFLQTAGVPMWGDYDNWDTLSFSNLVKKGVTLDKGENKSFLLYVDPDFNQIELTVQFLIILKSTTNPYDNLLTISWDQINLNVPDISLMYSSQNHTVEQNIEPNSIKTIEFSTNNGDDLTEVLLNQTTYTNASLMLIKWAYDLSGNLIRETELLNGRENSIYLPKYKNLQLDSRNFTGILLNFDSINEIEFQWNFTEINDTTINYEDINFQSEAELNFKLNQSNIAWRTVELPDVSQFYINFTGNPQVLITNWEISIEFYSLGSENLLFTLNSNGMNDSESVKMFTIKEERDYKNITTDFRSNIFEKHNLWWYSIGDNNQNIQSRAVTETLAMKISAIHNLQASLDLNCSINFVQENIDPMIDGEKSYLGSDNGNPFNITVGPDDKFYDLFHVKSFSFNNFEQFKWSLQTSNESNMEAAKLYCNDINTNKYPTTLNNAIISDIIDTSLLTGSKYLTFDLALYLGNNDEFHVYIVNQTDITEVSTYSETNRDTEMESINITQYSGDTIQIIFNLTTSSPGTGIGPIIDNIEISNTTDTIYFENFERNELDGWTQIDNLGGSDAYWHIDYEESSFNSAIINIIYPNGVSSFQGYDANPFNYNGFTKIEYDHNPFVQNGNTGYIVITPSSSIVQNFSVTLDKQEFTPVNLNLNDENSITQDLTTLNLISQSGYNWEIEESIDEIYPYYRLSLKESYKYQITFKILNQEDSIIQTSFYDGNGIANLNEEFNEIPQYIIDGTEIEILSNENTDLYLKIGFVTEDIHISIEIIEIPIEDGDQNDDGNNLNIILISLIAILSVTNILTFKTLSKSRKS